MANMAVAWKTAIASKPAPAGSGGAFSASWLENHASGGTGGIKPAVDVIDPPLGQGGGAPEMDDLALGTDRPAAAGQGTYIADAQVQGGVALALLQAGVNGAAHARVEQGRGITAMDAAQRVVMTGVRGALEHEVALGPFDGNKVQQAADRWRGQFAVADAVEELGRSQLADFGQGQAAGALQAFAHGLFLGDPLGERDVAVRGLHGRLLINTKNYVCNILFHIMSEI